MATAHGTIVHFMNLNVLINYADAFIQVCFTLNEDLINRGEVGDKDASQQVPREHPFTMHTAGGQTLAIFSQSDTVSPLGAVSSVETAMSRCTGHTQRPLHCSKCRASAATTEPLLLSRLVTSLKPDFSASITVSSFRQSSVHKNVLSSFRTSREPGSDLMKCRNWITLDDTTNSSGKPSRRLLEICTSRPLTLSMKLPSLQYTLRPCDLSWLSVISKKAGSRWAAL
ncbi:General transcription factor IIF subunit 2 [Liparis tanakae]|uniref:General transcription factor IIF subunit 2 n=1 Tax=Liparis tanakae TaxID=230148 RepID=A0A4Z2INJ2_9TELE|nr:General transcription factor IIF subunit 2 [Liparis tanakae]